ncbi:putative alpha-ketoglutarate-dependent sulfonate dioxygenase [Aspergillus caelatus]|uniref:Putative alpha-ketoglutarate-dependent sulfonate dioxygenase n=1 Tax=Aspergillus caelatus TaxID=61420 RepID=A0A5N6ZPU0_9EURO|nr:putative alpha-ketoglutarate-dependent sulfonate dioxygenase [Aspergillus caelatus]KAE8359233.1 putative alpha-ketoglutarate-dependent sulfonate dioxygenase [Aspergillus caelatus]
MAPSISTETAVPSGKGLGRVPMKLSGALDAFESFDVTPVIGREYPNANLKDFLCAPNSDALLRDLAITISQRGVVFFRKQDGLTDALQKELAQRLGELSGKPKTSGLHIHPVANSRREISVKDDEISVINSMEGKKLYKSRVIRHQTARKEWHSDITFEPIPSDYTILRLTVLPRTGGDTLWASGYELYDRLSPPYQKFLEGLDVTFSQPQFNQFAKDSGFEVFKGPRGAPENVGEELRAVHPLIRTNPVTGWKSVFAVGTHVEKINGLSDEESKHLTDWFVNLIMENHDLQVRHRWESPNDLAIWDNRSTYHAATWDYEEIGPRAGHRAVSLGEVPFYDPASTGRREALEKEAREKAALEKGE